MTATTIVCLVLVALFYKRIISTASGLLDLFDDGVDVGRVHMKAIKDDAQLSASLNSAEKKAELKKRLDKLNKSKASADHVKIDGLPPAGSPAPKRQPK